MLIYLTGTENNKKIENVIYEVQLDNDIFIGEPIKSNSIDLMQEVKSSLSKNKEINQLLIDLSVLTNSDAEIVKAVKTLRFYNSKCKFIIVALERTIGDLLLSELVNMGIYAIVTNEDDMLVKIKDYIINDATYKEASVFQISNEKEDKKSLFSFKEKTNVEKKIKNSTSKVILKPMKGKITVSLAGTQKRVGVTHTCILLAFNLMKKGYRVAVVEHNQHSDYQYLKNCYDNSELQNDFTSFIKVYQIDFYCNANNEILSRVQGLQYDYIIIDNGNIDDEDKFDLLEHNRADVKIVVFGAKAWEQHYLGNVFELGEETISNYRFLTMADDKTKKDILAEMDSYKVDFLNFKPEPFSEDANILNIMDGYLYEEVKKDSFIKSFFKKGN